MGPILIRSSDVRGRYHHVDVPQVLGHHKFHLSLAFLGIHFASWTPGLNIISVKLIHVIPFHSVVSVEKLILINILQGGIFGT